jgi:acetate kinase
MSVLLTLNAGSSSVKFAVYDQTATDCLVSGKVRRIFNSPLMQVKTGGTSTETPIQISDHRGAVRAIMDVLDTHLLDQPVIGVGHRVVHGGAKFSDPVVLTEDVRATLSEFIPLAPGHQPHNLAGVAAAIEAFPNTAHVACFDTGFHRSHPRVHDMYGLPRKYYDQGVRRYGFHGLSYTYLTQTLATDFPDLAQGNVVYLHLGNGASGAAVSNSAPISTTMGFSPLDGLAMGTRPGQLDPGVLLYLMRSDSMDADALETLLYKESGLKGISGMTNDMRALLDSTAPEAAEAVAYFCARASREIVAMAADMGGLDAVVFSGGIGENAPRIRAQILSGMEWCGIELDPAANGAGETVISSGRVQALVIPTNEEIVLARAAMTTK